MFSTFKQENDLQVMKKQLKKVPTEKALKAYGAMNHFFKGFVGLSHNYKYRVVDKTLFHRITGIPPSTGVSSESSMFPGMRVKEVCN